MSEESKGKALEIAELLAYQPGAVVSRTLIDKKVGTISVFAFDAGEGLSEHTAPFDAFVLILDGQAQITIENRSQTVSAGQMVIMPAHVAHSLRALIRFKMVLVMIRDEGDR